MLLSDTCPIAAAIINGEHDDHLDYIQQALGARRKRMFRKGAKVRLNGTRNVELEDQVGTIIKTNQRTVTVGIGTQDKWGFEREFNVPTSMLTPVEGGKP